MVVSLLSIRRIKSESICRLQDCVASTSELLILLSKFVKGYKIIVNLLLNKTQLHGNSDEMFGLNGCRSSNLALLMIFYMFAFLLITYVQYTSKDVRLINICSISAIMLIVNIFKYSILKFTYYSRVRFIRAYWSAQFCPI